MTLQAFQAALARLVTEPDFRERIRVGNETGFGRDLTEREGRRLRAVASERGVELTATLIKSFRLGKILTLLPLTRIVLGDRRLAREAKQFWQVHPPTSFYLVEEALAFCDYLEHRLRSGMRVAYLGEVVAYERAMLELRRVRADRGPSAPQLVRFRHDPRRLLADLGAGKRPHRVPARTCALSGVATASGGIQWRIVEDQRVDA